MVKARREERNRAALETVGRAIGELQGALADADHYAAIGELAEALKAARRAEFYLAEWLGE
jgi:Ser/Thr protein kinase RdoA (MazF antagonist)